MGYFNKTKVTTLKVTFNGDWNAFGIARKQVELRDFSSLYDSINSNIPFYGIFPYWSKKYCNIPVFHKNLKGTFKKGESYLVTYDPINSQLIIDGGRLRKKIMKKV